MHYNKRAFWRAIKHLEQLQQLMAVDQKELLQKTHIRTMRKDLQRLREFDVTKEHKNIAKELPAKKAPVVENKSAQQAPKPITPPHPVDQALILEAKKHADEKEKQQIFFVESKKNDLEKSVETITKKEELPLAEKKNTLVQERKTWKQKLDSFIGTHKEKSEDPKTEKQQWKIEKELARVDGEIKTLETNHQNIIEKKQSLQKEITDGNISLESISHEALQKEATKKIQEKEETHPPAKEHSAPHHKTPLHHAESLKNIPTAVKEKLQTQTNVEEEKRLKFMEDVERWASLNQKNNQHE